MAAIQSYSPNYFSLTDILVTQERTPCKFLVEIPKLGKLNPAVDEQDLKAGTVLEVPIWLITELSKGRQEVLAPELPKIYREAYREILKADANAVDLHKFNLFFYEFGSYSRKFDTRKEVQDILIHTFKTRFRYILDLIETCTLDPAKQQKLDILERKLYADGHEYRLKLNNWLKESGVPIEAAEMVKNHKKRKRVDIENS